jgi:hypothetical protein
MQAAAAVVAGGSYDQNPTLPTSLNRLFKKRIRFGGLCKFPAADVDNVRPVCRCEADCPSEVKLRTSKRRSSLSGIDWDNQSTASRRHSRDRRTVLTKNHTSNVGAMLRGQVVTRETVNDGLHST